jgi:hypothetical protein
LVAGAGHDTEKFNAPVTAYKSLPECCRYARTNNGKKQVAKL